MGGVTRSQRNIRWIESYCLVPDGKGMGHLVKLRPWQKAELQKIYDNPHGTRRAILSFPRKNGKTALVAFLMLLHLCGPEAKANSQLYSAAQSRDQAAVLFDLACKAVRLSPDLSGVIQIRDSAKELLCPELGTRYKALSAEDRTAHGLSPIFAVHDELGQVRGPRSRLYETIETGMGAHEAPLSIIISTQAPTDDDLLSVLIDDALAGGDPQVTVSLYTAPDDMDAFSDEAIKKANPAFGDFLNAATIRGERDAAQRMPSAEASYRNLHLNQRVEANDPYVSRALWDACAGEVAGSWPEGGFGGLDLSSSNDLTAFVRCVWIDGTLHVRSTFWIPRHAWVLDEDGNRHMVDGVAEKARKDRVPYDVWRDQGHLETTPGATVDYDYVAPIILRLMREEGLSKVAFDRWNMRFLRPALERAGATVDELEQLVEFGQGFQSMSPALRALDQVLLNGRMAHGGHPVLTMCAANSVVKMDPAGNRKLVKLAPNRRIDGMISLAMAVAMAGEPAAEKEPEYRMLVLG